MECDNVLVAIGQAFDLSFVDPQRDGLQVTDQGRIDCDPVTGSTSADDLFVTGVLLMIYYMPSTQSWRKRPD